MDTFRRKFPEKNDSSENYYLFVYYNMSSQLFHLTKAQRDKLESGQSIQVSHRQLHSPNDKERHAAEIDMSDEGLKKMGGAIRQGKGFRLNQQHYKGYGFLDDAKKFATKNGGKAAEGVKKLVPKSAMETVILNGLTAAGMSPESAAMISSTGVAAIYATDFSKPVGDQTGKILSTTVNTGVKQYKKNKTAADAVPVAAGGSIWKALQQNGGNQFKNGKGFYEDVTAIVSQTPIQIKMAHLRSLKKKKAGGSFQGGDIKLHTPAYYENMGGLNNIGLKTREPFIHKFKDSKASGGSFKGGSFKGSGFESNVIVDSDKVKRALAKYEGNGVFPKYNFKDHFV